MMGRSIKRIQEKESALLVFAHRGEAQVFLEKAAVKRKMDRFEMWELDEEKGCDYLLISGEGRINALCRVASALGWLSRKRELTRVVNLGIAGALDDLAGDAIYPIRTSYAHTGAKPVFQSFTSAEKNATLDAVSSDERVLDDKMAVKLSYFGQIVDRELWGIARAASEFRLPFLSYKIISDRAGSKTNCFELKNRARKWSEKLWFFYQGQRRCQKTTFEEKGSLVDRLRKEGFHFTKHQKDLFEKLLERFHNRKGHPQNELAQSIENLKASSLSPKDRTRKLILLSEKKAAPVFVEVAETMNKITEPLRKAGWQAKIPVKKDPPSLSVQAHITCDDQKAKLAAALKNFDIDGLLAK